jgi:hypothetical protein
MRETNPEFSLAFASQQARPMRRDFERPSWAR